ncbi:recombinase family protein [Priestia megaterium]|uniref:recombinase family protein n=1 Tax=Priestia megaterium TaxID=1404 RepID=UPI000BF85F3B|nr:recombinase family protein [Priestia megaterium]PFR88900.1 resolvase [Priestia megaterium]
MGGTKVGYIRVSTEQQNLEQQKELLSEKGIERWYEEKVSGKNMDRPEFQKMMDWVREGDEIYIRDFSRLARSTKDLLNIVTELKERGVKIHSIKDNIDTTTAHGEMMLTVLAAMNQFERENLLERQREGIEIAKRKGKYKGRKKVEKPSNWDEVIEKWKSRKITATAAIQETGLKRTTFYKLLNESKEAAQEG